MPKATQAKLLSKLTPDEAALLLEDWGFIARPNQLTPSGEWYVWLILAGRGWGKTRTGAEWVIAQAIAGRNWGAIVGRTAADARDVMVEGESGILNKSPSWFMPKYEPSKRRLTWPNGVTATTFSADIPDQLRGPQHSWAWADEMAAWRYMDAWDNLQMGLRLGDNPQVVVTTTPRPIPRLKELISRPDTHLTRGSTYENKNLSAKARRIFAELYEGTRLGRQELYAELLSDVLGALWTHETIEKNTIKDKPYIAEGYERIIVAIDPAVSANENSSNETGIIVAGKKDSKFYVIDDLSGIYQPSEWAKIANDAYEHWQCDAVVIEVNQGGDMAKHTLKTVNNRMKIKAVRATRGKYTRAEPIAALYEQGKVKHHGTFAKLEDQLCTWVQGSASPDRLDALVWAITDLALGASRNLDTAENPFFN